MEETYLKTVVPNYFLSYNSEADFPKGRYNSVLQPVKPLAIWRPLGVLEAIGARDLMQVLAMFCPPNLRHEIC